MNRTGDDAAPTVAVGDGPAFERLGPTACWDLLHERDFGRICFSVEEVTHVLLTGYVVEDHTVYFRSSAFGPVARQVETRPVTLQIDDMQAHHQAGWSATFTGSAHRVQDAPTMASLWRPVRPTAWGHGIETLWIALDPDDVRGQRVRA
ncbi:MAG: pyridoxamine 5'-phosphate oxidase family protein [Nocardioides sp.]|nr:pyridoxamine 5'-phosphate oxidase family protein [Nocardioides sp.]